MTVRKCTITGFQDGIQLFRSSGNSLITNTISGTSNNGIAFEDDNNDNLVKGNRVVAAGNDAINVDRAATGNTFLTNTLDGAGVSEDGIDFDSLGGATGNTVRGTRISGFSNSGIKLSPGSDANLIAENRSEGNFTGILVYSGTNTIERNTANANSGDGVLVSGNDNIIDGNRGRQNDQSGLIGLGIGPGTAPHGRAVLELRIGWFSTVAVAEVGSRNTQECDQDPTRVAGKWPSRTMVGVGAPALRAQRKRCRPARVKPAMRFIWCRPA